MLTYTEEGIDFGAFYQNKSSYTSTSIMRKIQRLFRKGTLMNIKVLNKFVRDNIGDITFQEAYDKTGWILNITVTGYHHA